MTAINEQEMRAMAEMNQHRRSRDDGDISDKDVRDLARAVLALLDERDVILSSPNLTGGSIDMLAQLVEVTEQRDLTLADLAAERTERDAALATVERMKRETSDLRSAVIQVCDSQDSSRAFALDRAAIRKAANHTDQPFSWDRVDALRATKEPT